MAELTTNKILIDGVISTPDVCTFAFDSKDFYLNASKEHNEYTPIPIHQFEIPTAIFEPYNLQDITHNDHV
jgi:hypothetical protein